MPASEVLSLYLSRIGIILFLPRFLLGLFSSRRASAGVTIGLLAIAHAI